MIDTSYSQGPDSVFEEIRHTHNKATLLTHESMPVLKGDFESSDLEILFSLGWEVCGVTGIAGLGNILFGWFWKNKSELET